MNTNLPSLLEKRRKEFEEKLRSEHTELANFMWPETVKEVILAFHDESLRQVIEAITWEVWERKQHKTDGERKCEQTIKVLNEILDLFTPLEGTNPPSTTNNEKDKA